MENLHITASDTLFFGTGRPFTMGEDSWSKGLFPPSPETLYGFLRGCYFVENMTEIGKANTFSDPTNDLKINYFGLMLKDGDKEAVKLFPLPNDIVKNHTNDKLELLSLCKSDSGIISNHPINNDWKLITPDLHKTVKPAGQNYISEMEFKAYLKHKRDGFNLENIEDIIGVEPKIGIFMDRSDANNKKLYRAQLSRLEKKRKQISLWVVYEGLTLSENIINRLGGEGKLVFANKIDVPTVSENSFKAKKDDIVRIYLATPALFENGWKLELDGVELLTAAMGRPQWIGGFDSQKKRPKPMQKAVPAGSVYYVKVLKDEIVFPSHIGIPDDKKKGYGRVYCNKINYKPV